MYPDAEQNRVLKELAIVSFGAKVGNQPTNAEQVQKKKKELAGSVEKSTQPMGTPGTRY